MAMAKTPQIVRVETIKPRLVGITDAARYLGLAVKTLRNRTGPKATDPLPIPVKRIGKKVLFDVADLDQFIDSL
jgi:hypothetical protein